MIFFVDAKGAIAVASAAYLKNCQDGALLRLLLEATWCLSFAQACELSRERRRRQA